MNLEARFRVARGDRSIQVEFTIAAGQTVALLGPNGAGKSTVVAAVAGLYPIEEGTISLGDRVLDAPALGVSIPPERRKMGIVFQNLALFPALSVAENIAFGPRSRGLGQSAARDLAGTWADRIGLVDRLDALPAELSGGEAQRVALARALASEPDALLLDEPLSALDVTARAAMRRLLAEHLTSFTGPRLLVTHDPAEAHLLADTIHVLEDGRIVQSGTPDDIRLRPATAFVADLAGVNLFEGVGREGTVELDGHTLHLADQAASGPMVVLIHPRAVSLHRERPNGSPRNVWETQVLRVEPEGSRVRVLLGAPLHMTAEVTAGAIAALGIERGSTCWVAIKATEIQVSEG